MFRRASAAPRDFGRVLIGLGLMLMALRQLLDLVTPFEDAPSLRLLLGAVATEPVLDVLIAAGLTWAAHSSVAVVLLVMALADKGVVPPEAAFALVLGANIGTAINPVLEGAAGDDPAARRVSIGNLLCRVTGVAAALALLGPFGRLMVVIEPNPARAVADFHTFFNIALAAAFLPLLKPYAALLRRLLPPRLDLPDPAQPLYLNPAALETPPIALGGASREALRLADVLDTMLQGLREALENGDRKRIADTKRLDDVLDRLDSHIKAYLAALDPEAMTEADHARARQILAFAVNMEHAGDVVEKDLLALAAKKARRGLVFPGDLQTELLTTLDRVAANTRTAASLFLTADTRAARLLAAEKEAFRDIEAKAMTAHLERPPAGQTEARELSAMRLDILRELKRINAHLVAAAAYPVLEDSGELLPNRLRRAPRLTRYPAQTSPGRIARNRPASTPASRNATAKASAGASCPSSVSWNVPQCTPNACRAPQSSMIRTASPGSTCCARMNHRGAYAPIGNTATSGAPNRSRTARNTPPSPYPRISRHIDHPPRHRHHEPPPQRPSTVEHAPPRPVVRRVQPNRRPTGKHHTPPPIQHLDPAPTDRPPITASFPNGAITTGRSRAPNRRKVSTSR